MALSFPISVNISLRMAKRLFRSDREITSLTQLKHMKPQKWKRKVEERLREMARQGQDCVQGLSAASRSQGSPADSEQGHRSLGLTTSGNEIPPAK